MKHLETMRQIARTQRRRAEAAEARVAELEAAIATHQKERLPHMTNAHDRALWSLINP